MENIRQKYLEYLDSFIQMKDTGHDTELLLPLFDRHGDQLSVIIEKDGNTYIIHDDGNVMADLAASGVDVSGNIKDTIGEFCVSNNIQMSEYDLFMTSARTSLPRDIHLFGLALLQISNMGIAFQQNDFSNQ